MRATVILLVVAALAACGGDDEASDDTTTTEEVTTTTAEGPTTTGEVDPAGEDAWRANATEHRQAGGEHEYECPPGGTPDTIWGVETYSDDSSVCTAAVHVGLITLEDGGTVTIVMAPGEEFYDAGVANGITSISYPAYPSSFTFPDAPPGSGDFDPSPASWAETGANLEVGDSRTIECSPAGTLSSVWGTGTYTADSKICSAAVLEGLITVEDGGEVTIEIVDGLDSYEGSTANGVTSSDYPAYPKSFELTP
jgi:LCCL domain